MQLSVVDVQRKIDFEESVKWINEQLRANFRPYMNEDERLRALVMQRNNRSVLKVDLENIIRSKVKVVLDSHKAPTVRKRSIGINTQRKSKSTDHKQDKVSITSDDETWRSPLAGKSIYYIV